MKSKACFVQLEVNWMTFNWPKAEIESLPLCMCVCVQQQCLLHQLHLGGGPCCCPTPVHQQQLQHQQSSSSPLHGVHCSGGSAAASAAQQHNSRSQSQQQQQQQHLVICGSDRNSSDRSPLLSFSEVTNTLLNNQHGIDP